MHAFTAESLKSIRPLLQSRRICTLPAFVALVLLAVTACTSAQTPGQQDATARGDASLDGLAPLTLPDVQPVELNGDKLRVVATTSIIGDVVGQVGGDAIDLTVLMGPGQDPHGFEPSAGDLRAAAEADAIFVNGWDLEEGLLEDLRNVSAGIPLVPVSAGIPPLPFSGHDEEGATSRPVADPHSWLDPVNVLQWVENIEHVLLALDGSSSIDYTKNASAYTDELQDLAEYYSERTNSVPAGRRKLVTNHDTLAYFAKAYDFEVVGVVIPGGSTLGEPSAGDLARLLEKMRQENTCTIFVETTANDQLASTLAAELDACPSVAVVPLYTGALGAADGPAGSYVGMMRANIDMIAEALR